MIEVDINRHSHLIDPHLHIWGWQITVYLFLGDLVAGLMVLAVLQTLQWRAEGRSRWSRWTAFVAPALLSAGMLALLLDLKYKTHLWRFYTAFHPASPMSSGSWILLLIYPATTGLALASLTRAETDRLAPRRDRASDATVDRSAAIGQRVSEGSPRAGLGEPGAGEQPGHVHGQFARSFRSAAAVGGFGARASVFRFQAFDRRSLHDAFSDRQARVPNGAAMGRRNDSG